MINSNHDGKWVLVAVSGNIDRIVKPKRHERKQTTCTDQSMKRYLLIGRTSSERQLTPRINILSSECTVAPRAEALLRNHGMSRCVDTDSANTAV